MNKGIKWLEPWWSTEEMDADFHETFCKQLKLEVSPGHPLHNLPIELIGRGNGDDVLFGIADGSGRVTVVHLTWKKGREKPPFPISQVFKNIDAFVEERMLPEHREWMSE